MERQEEVQIQVPIIFFRDCRLDIQTLQEVTMIFREPTPAIRALVKAITLFDIIQDFITMVDHTIPLSDIIRV